VWKGLALLFVFDPLGRVGLVRYLRHIYYGVGMLTGLLGWRFSEYRGAHDPER